MTPSVPGHRLADRLGAVPIVAFTALASVLLVAGCGGDDDSASALVLEACTADGSPARCGTLMVPEDRSGGNDHEIPVRVVVFPAIGSDPQPDPVVWFAGGPGDSAIDTISRVRPLLAPANPDRDLVFVEQRGTGMSATTCPAFPPDSSDTAAIRSAVESCVDSLVGDPRFYGTSQFADDLDEVLAGLDYDEANLVGISYGPTAEQVFLARHPDRVRTMTLLSGTLLDVPVLERFPASAQTAIDNVFAECAADTACNDAFPQLRSDWDAMWTSLHDAPWVVSADRSPDGTEAVFDADFVASGLHDLLFVAPTHTRIPLVVHTLGAADDKAGALLAIAQAYPDTSAGAPGDEQLLEYLIRCNEPWARYDPANVTGTDSFEYDQVRNDAGWWQSVCSAIPEVIQDSSSAAPPRSDVPVLALNGEKDPQDPPSNMAGAAAVWPNSLALTVPGQGHDIDPTSAQCIIPLIQSFIDRGTTAALDTACLSKLPSPTFDVTLPGT